MLKFRQTNILFLFLLIFYLEIHFLMHISWLWLLGLAFIYSIILYFGASRINSDFYFHVICNADPSKDSVLLTFDDGPDPKVTPKVLDVLKKYDARAVFFLIGKNAESYPDLVRRMIAEGHIIGNHTYSHSNLFDLLASKAMQVELLKTQQLILEISGVSIRWFRPPFGVTNPMLKKALNLTGLVPVGWSLRSMDTTIKDENKIHKRLRKVKSGDIILMHDRTKDISGLLDNFLKVLEEKKLAVADPEVLLGVPAYNK
jgi:peptidoglycan-N-acetylglucosamine deacetylase